MFLEDEMFNIAEKVVDGVFEEVGEVEGELNLKRVFNLFLFISLLGWNRLNSLREEMRSCQKTE